MSLAEIIAQLESCGYTCEAGPLERNRAFIALKAMAEQECEPYFGWCDVDGCEKGSVNNGGCWPETGYWLCCYEHSKDYRDGLPQPQMKQAAIDREKTRGADGFLP